MKLHEDMIPGFALITAVLIMLFVILMVGCPVKGQDISHINDSLSIVRSDTANWTSFDDSLIVYNNNFIDLNKIEWKQQNGFYFDESAMPDWNWNTEYIVVTLLYLWGEYEKQCYNDSSQTTKHIGDYRYCYYYSTGWDISYCNNPSHYDKTIWTHKNQTLPGFMKWLKKFQK